MTIHRFQISKSYGFKNDDGVPFVITVISRHSNSMLTRDDAGNITRRHIKVVKLLGGHAEGGQDIECSPSDQPKQLPDHIVESLERRNKPHKSVYAFCANKPIPTPKVIRPALVYTDGRLATVDALKTSSTAVATATRFHQATTFLTRFCGPGPVARETVRTMLDAIAGMTEDDMRELERIRRYLRGE